MEEQPSTLEQVFCHLKSSENGETLLYAFEITIFVQKMAMNDYCIM